MVSARSLESPPRMAAREKSVAAVMTSFLDWRRELPDAIFPTIPWENEDDERIFL